MRYYIGNQPLNQYLASTIQTERDYGKKIQTALRGLTQMIDTGDTFNGLTFIDQDNFDRFVKKFSDSASGAAGASAAVPRADVASDDSAAEFDKTCVINSDQVSFLGTPFAWQDHETPLEITDFGFAQKNKKLMVWLNENVEKFVFFKAELTSHYETAMTHNLFEDKNDAIFLSIHFKKTRENYCALATFKDKDAFNIYTRIYDKSLRFPHFLLFPNNQPGTNDTTDQANVATCYIGKYLPLPITYNDFVKVIDKFVEYKNAGCDEALAREFYSDDPTVLALFGRLSAQMASLSLGE
jgi:hypothetical protein